MPPALALVLCAVFVLSLLYVEWRGSPRVSGVLWIPTLWILVATSKPLAIWLAIPGSNESGSVLDRILLASLGAAGMVVLTSRGVNWPNALRGHGWLLALLAYMFVSTLWSDIPLIALRRWARDLIVVIMALFIRSEANPRQAVESLLRRSAYILIPFSLVLVKYFPAL